MFAIREKQTTAGRVEQVTRSHGCNGESAQVFYSFSTPEGVTYRGEETLCAGSPYAGVREGESVPVVYVKSKPELHGIAGSPKTSAEFPLPVLLFPFFALLVFVPLFWPRYAQLLRDRKLYRTGPVLARGKVVFIAREQSQSWPGWPTSTRSTVYIQVQGATLGSLRAVSALTTGWPATFRRAREGRSAVVATRKNRWLCCLRIIFGENRGAMATRRKGKRWTQRVTEGSNALDLEAGVFALEDPRKIARSLKRSAERSTRRKAPPFRSAMSMLVFYINRAGVI